jgi:hypothetical protein
MTVTSELESKLEAAWPDISKAVTEGVTEDEKREVAKLVTVVDGAAELARYVTLSWAQPNPAGVLKVRDLVAAPGAVRELRTEMDVKTESIAEGIGSIELELKKWAKDARGEERKWVLRSIARWASIYPEIQPTSLDSMGPGWRVVATGGVENLKDACKKRDIDFVECDASELAGFKALAYKVDRFSIERLEDFSLTFDYTDSGVRLALTARVLQVGFDGQTGAKKFLQLGTFPKPTP